MKKAPLFVVVLALIIVPVFWWMSEFSPGTLGAVAETDLNCSETDVARRIDDLLTLKPYQVNMRDSTLVSWWDDGGYDFLTYRCINIQKRLYMVTISSEEFEESTISIRAYYHRKRKKWIFANEFNPESTRRAEKAMTLLTYEMSTRL